MGGASSPAVLGFRMPAEWEPHAATSVIIVGTGPGIYQFGPQVNLVPQFPENTKVVSYISARILSCGFRRFKIIAICVVIETGFNPESGTGLCVEANAQQGYSQGKQCSFHIVFFLQHKDSETNRALLAFMLFFLTHLERHAQWLYCLARTYP
jgi:hypothetical protein